jgi:hypothetical protein
LKKHIFYLLAVLFAFYTDAQPGKSTLRQNMVNQSNNPAHQAATENSPNGTAPMTIESRGNDSIDKKVSSPFSSLGYKGSPDSVIRIGIILPFDAKNSSDRLYASMSDNDQTRSEPNQLKESSQNAIVEQLMLNDSLRACDIIIGPTNANQSKVVSGFCKKNRIINIQPFVASKSFSSENPYLVRFMPTIDAHLQAEYEMVLDSFSDANIIIYTTKKERDLSAARYLDTLFSSYNAINTHKLSYSFVNAGDSTIPVAQRSLSSHKKPNQRNVVMMTCYDEPVVNSQLRMTKDEMVVFGMPTWIDAEQIRADYLNKAEPYFTDNYFVDTTQSKVNDFITTYKTANGQRPSRYSFLGYDAMRYLCNVFHKYGKNFKLGFDNESYDGMGFSFHISPVIRISKTSGIPVINYYTNTAMHLFQVSDYKVWKVK